MPWKEDLNANGFGREEMVEEEGEATERLNIFHTLFSSLFLLLTNREVYTVCCVVLCCVADKIHPHPTSSSFIYAASPISILLFQFFDTR